MVLLYERSERVCLKVTKKCEGETMKKFCALALLASGLSQVAVAAEAPAGHRNNPLKFALVPSTDSEKMMDSAKPLAQCILEKTKLYVNFSIPNSYIAVLETLASNQSDIALITSTTYATGVSRGDKIEPLLKMQRFGGTTYRGAIYVRADSGINTLKDLNGKKFAFVDPLSGSGTLAPKELFAKEGVKLKETIYANKHDIALTMVLQKQVDASAGFYNEPKTADNKPCKEVDNKACFSRDVRDRIKTEYPNAWKDAKILALTDELPNDPIVVRSSLEAPVKKALQEALPGCFADLNTKGININNIEGAEVAGAKDYENLVKMIVEAEKAAAKK